ncbi:hypothetical protein [Xylanibacter brevis]|uniref:hypothetical protein n=1 Tax=Xylanibacter brevis TaxID=83231 RepID=UPI00048840A3|nr:hypothetical protein [Xylanibacter brevis]
MTRLFVLMVSLLPCINGTCCIQDTVSTDTLPRRFIVINMETGVPIRNVLITTDDGQETVSTWEGVLQLKSSFKELTLMHASFEKRRMRSDELQGDTIELLPRLFSVNEVVIWGKHHDKTATAFQKPSKVDMQLMEANPKGFNPLGLIYWGIDELWLKKQRRRKAAEKQRRKMILENY